MRYMLDTNICIYLIKNKPQGVLARLEGVYRLGVGISAVTLAELEHGVALSAYPKRNGDALIQFLSVLTVLPFDALAAAQYGLVRANLQRRGLLIGSMDMLIAAHARACDCVLVTNNVREFERVEGLVVEDWVVP